MTVDTATAARTAAGLHVLRAEVVGRQIRVLVAPLTVTVETVVRRLGVPVTVSHGDGSGNVALYFEAQEAT